MNILITMSVRALEVWQCTIRRNSFRERLTIGSLYQSRRKCQNNIQHRFLAKTAMRCMCPLINFSAAVWTVISEIYQEETVEVLEDCRRREQKTISRAVMKL